MAKKRVSIFDLPREDLQQISESTIQQNAKPATEAQRSLDRQPAPKKTDTTGRVGEKQPAAQEKEKRKPTRKKRAPQAKQPEAAEPLKVIRVRESLHRRAKGQASLAGLSLGAYIEQLISAATKE